jgi:hypothetical protein
MKRYLNADIYGFRINAVKKIGAIFGRKDRDISVKIDRAARGVTVIPDPKRNGRHYDSCYD